MRSDEVIDLMIKEYPAKHAEYSVILQEKERQRITDHYKEYSVSIEVTNIFYLVWGEGHFVKLYVTSICNIFISANATTEYTES